MFDGLLTGWIASLDIPSALNRLPIEDVGADHVLVTMLDSTPDVRRLPSLVPVLKRRGVAYTVVENDVAVELRHFMDIVATDDCLSGFDEIWLSCGVPSAGKPEQFRLTSDVPLNEAGAPPGLAEWMRQSACCLGLGDGDGLNFATFRPSLVPLLQVF